VLPRVWPVGVGLATDRLRVRSPAVSLSGNNLGQVVHTRVPLLPSSQFGTGQGAVMSSGWEGNRRSGVALASVVYPPTGPRPNGGIDEHPAYTPHWALHTLHFYGRSLLTKQRAVHH